MSTTPNPAAAQTFMVVATIRDDTNFAEFAALRDDEQKQLKVLRSEGRIGAHYVPPPGGQRSSRLSPTMRSKSRRRWQPCLSPGSSMPMSTRPRPRTQRRPPTVRGREPGAALPAAMTSLPDSRAPAGVGFAAPDHRCRGSSAARPSARPVHSVYRHKEICMPEIARATPQAISI